MSQFSVKYGNVYLDKVPDKWQFVGTDQIKQKIEVEHPFIPPPNYNRLAVRLSLRSSVEFSGFLGLSFEPATLGRLTVITDYVNTPEYNMHGIAKGLTNEHAQEISSEAATVLNLYDRKPSGLLRFNYGAVDYKTSPTFHRWLVRALLYIYLSNEEKLTVEGITQSVKIALDNWRLTNN